MGKIAETVAETKGRKAGGNCWAAVAADVLSDGDAADLAEALESTLSHTVLAEALNASGVMPEGMRMSSNKVSWHRRRMCSCPV